MLFSFFFFAVKKEQSQKSEEKFLPILDKHVFVILDMVQYRPQNKW